MTQYLLVYNPYCTFGIVIPSPKKRGAALKLM